MINFLFPSFRFGASRLLPRFCFLEAFAGATLATWGYIAVGVGTAVGGYLSKPKAPKAAHLQTVDPQDEQRAAIQGNLDNADDIEALVSRSNSFTQAQANGLMEKAMPGYANISAKFMKQADGLLTDPYNVPTDVADNLTRIAAERGISTGVRGQAGEFSLLRDLGVNSLQIGGQRISQAQSIIQTIGGLAPRVNPMSPISFYVTPAQQLQSKTGTNAAQFSANQAQNNAEAAASNAQSSMWGGAVANLAGMAGGALINGDKTDPDAGKGPATTYDDFILNNPNSSAARGGTPTKFVDETWKL